MARVNLLRLAAVLSLLPPDEELPAWTLGQGSPWPSARSVPPPLHDADAERVRAAQAKRARKAAKLEALAAKGAIRGRP